MIIRPQPATRQPSDYARINWGHPLAKGLIHYGPVGVLGRELVTGNIPTDVSSAASDFDRHGTTQKGYAWESHSTTDGGCDYGPNRLLSSVMNGGITGTICCIAALDSTDNWGKMLIIPQSLTAWSAPFQNWALGRSNNTTSAQFAWYGGSSNTFATSDTGMLSLDGSIHTYGGVNDGTTSCRFFRDGNLHSVNTGSWTGGGDTIVLNTDHFFSLSRNQTASGEGINGRLILSAAWARNLSDIEMMAFHQNPWQMLLYSNVMPINTHVAAAAAASNVTSGLVNGGLIA